MDPVTMAFILAIIELIGKYGIPGFQAIMAEWQKEIVTLDDIKALKNIVPYPDTYFPKKVT